MPIVNQWELTITANLACDMNAPDDVVAAMVRLQNLQDPDGVDDEALGRAYRALIDREVVCVNRSRRHPLPGNIVRGPADGDLLGGPTE